MKTVIVIASKTRHQVQYLLEKQGPTATCFADISRQPMKYIANMNSGVLRCFNKALVRRTAFCSKSSSHYGPHYQQVG